MPRPTVTVCLEQGCPELRPCPHHGHELEPWGNSDRRSELPGNWETIRKRVLKRDGHRCTHRADGRRCMAQATDVHHRGDPSDHRDDNLASLCAPHHRTETSLEAAEARRFR